MTPSDLGHLPYFKRLRACSRRAILIVLSVALHGCSSLHSVQIGEQDFSKRNRSRFDVKVNSTGVNVGEATGISKAIIRDKNFGRAANTVNDVWQMITFGPRTGEVTFADDYADGMPKLVAERCVGRPISGLVVMRETTKYPVISGEIVRVQGSCE